eukprot:m51a1_g11459 hypothetical protein (705) ;mRNA; f:4518-7605
MEAQALEERARALALLRAHVVPAIAELSDLASLFSAAPRALRSSCLAHAASGPWSLHQTAFGTFAQSERFADGFMAQTWEAMDVRNGRLVMCKTFWLNDTLAHKVSSIVERLKKLQSIKHPYLLPILGAHLEPDRLFIFMKFMQKGSLCEFRNRTGEFSEEVARPYVTQVLVGLQYLQENGFFHGAIKGSNVLLSENGNVMLSDFALADSISEAFGRSSAIGPIYWTAPEVIEGKAILSDKQDVWSVACLVHELMTYGPPHGKLPPLRALYLIVKEPIPKINFASANLQDFLARCFNKNPAHRPTFAELLAHPWITPKDPAPAVPLSSPDDIKAILQRSRSRFLPGLQCLTIEEASTWRTWSALPFGNNAVWLGGGNGVLTVWDTAKCTVTSRIEVHKTRIYCLLNVLNRRVWCSSEDGGIYVINPAKLSLKRLAVHDDEHKLIKRMVHTDPEDKHGRIWSLAPGNETSQIVALSKRGEVKFQMTVKRFINTIEANPATQLVYLGCVGSVVVLDATTYETQHVIDFAETPAAALKIARVIFTLGDLMWIAAGNHMFVFFGENKKPDKEYALRTEITSISTVRDILLCGCAHGGVEAFSLRSCEHAYTLMQGPSPQVLQPPAAGAPAAEGYPVKCICTIPDAGGHGLSIWIGSYANNFLHVWRLMMQQPPQPQPQQLQSQPQPQQQAQQQVNQVQQPQPQPQQLS